MKSLYIFLITVLLLVSNSVVMAEANEESVTQSTSLEDERSEMKFREEFGLETNTDTIKSAFENYEVGRFGVRLSPEEEKELTNRIQFQENTTPKLRAILSAEFGDDYTLYIDQKNQGTYHIGVKKEISEINNVKALFNETNKFIVSTIEYSELDLVTLQNKIIESIDYLDEKGIVYRESYTDVIDQKVYVGIDDFTVSKEKMLTDLFGDTVIVQQAGGGADDNRASTSSTMKGGLRITNSNGGSCSVGFMVERASDSKKFVATAGHCATADYYQGTNSIGHMLYEDYGPHADVAYIGYGPSNVDYTGGKIYKTSTTNEKYDRTQNAQEDVVGEAVCMSGASTETNSIKCGTLKDRNYSWRVNDVLFTELRCATYTSASGDSGGTVFGGTTLKGINKGHNSGFGIYSQMELAMEAISDKYGTTFYIIF